MLSWERAVPLVSARLALGAHAGSVSKHKRAPRSAEFGVAGDWVRHEARGIGQISGFDQKGPKPLEVSFVSGEVHRYTLKAASTKLLLLSAAHAPTQLPPLSAGLPE